MNLQTLETGFYCVSPNSDWYVQNLLHIEYQTPHVGKMTLLTRKEFVGMQIIHYSRLNELDFIHLN